MKRLIAALALLPALLAAQDGTVSCPEITEFTIYDLTHRKHTIIHSGDVINIDDHGGEDALLNIEIRTGCHTNSTNVHLTYFNEEQELSRQFHDVTHPFTLCGDRTNHHGTFYRSCPHAMATGTITLTATPREALMMGEPKVVVFSIVNGIDSVNGETVATNPVTANVSPPPSGIRIAARCFGEIDNGVYVRPENCTPSDDRACTAFVRAVYGEYVDESFVFRTTPMLNDGRGIGCSTYPE